MANHSPKKSGRRRRPPTAPRHAVVFEKGAFSEIVAELKSLSERSGSAIGNAYARAASSFLHGRERLEDLNAERRHRRRQGTKAGATSPSVPRTVPTKQISSTRK